MNTCNANALQLARTRLAGRAAIAIVAVSLSLPCLAANTHAGESDHARQDAAGIGSFNMNGVSIWFKERFTDAELRAYRPEDFRIESHACSCYDRPEPHYPYLLVFFSTPKGDLVGRPDRRGIDTVITQLAVRHGEQYCDVDAEDQCYGSFAHPCDFSDFRYGPQLAAYFPTCMSIDADSALTPVRY